MDKNTTSLQAEIKCPKKPNESALIELIRAYQFIIHSKEHASLHSDFDLMVAIHNLDDSVEYFLNILVDHLDIELSE